MRTEEGELKDACKKIFEAHGFYYRSLCISGIPGRTNPSKGMSDAVICKQGYVAWIEYKSAKGKLSEEQEEFIFEWISHGGNSFVVRTINEALEIIQKSRQVKRLDPPQECTRCLSSLPSF